MELRKEQVNKIRDYFDKTYSRTPGKVTIILPVLALIILLLVFLTFFVFASPILNRFVKNKLISSVEANPGCKIIIGSISYHPFRNGISIENLEFTRINPKDSTDKILIKNVYTEIYNVNWLFFLLGKGLRLDNIYLQNVSFQINRPDPGNNIKSDTAGNSSRNKKASLRKLLTELIPGKLLPLKISEFTLNSGNLIAKVYKDTKDLLTDSINNISFKINGINIAGEEKSTLSIAEKFYIRADRLNHRFIDSKYELKLDSLIISSGDSLVSVRSLEFYPYVGDSLFFFYKKYRANRYLTRINKLRITGMDFTAMMSENSLLINKIIADSFLADIVTNKRLPDDPHKTNPKMPNELFNSIESKVRINSLRLSRGQIRYTELFPYSDDPAVLLFKNVNADIENISNFKADTGKKNTRINISSNLAGEGKLTVKMNIDLISDALSLSYKGKLDSMDMTRLNEFLKLDAGVIVKSCKVKYVTFDVEVHNGVASGSVQPVYDNLKIEKLDKEKGKSNLLSKVLSFFARNAKIHESNPQEGELRTGKVDRRHSRDEAFFHFIWVSVRDALGDAVGF